MSRKTKQNNITSPELIAQISKENADLIKDFLDYLRSTQKRPSTIEQYRYDLHIAFVWNVLNNDNKFFVKWSKRNVVSFQNYLLNENGNSPARVRRLKASLASLSNYIYNILDDEYPEFRPIVNKIENPVLTPVREKSIFSEEEIDGLLEELTMIGRYDQACALALALCSGRRKSELLRFRVSDFTEDRLVCGGSLYKTSAISTKGRGINGKMLECFCLAKRFKPYLDRWNEYKISHGIESEWLFPKKDNPAEALPVTTLDTWADKFTTMLNDKSFYWHSMRHMTVTMFLRNGVPAHIVQKYLGWADISLVSVYSDLSTDEELSKYFTADGIVVPQGRSFNDM